MFREAALNVSFQPAMMLHSIGQCIADDRNVIALVQLQLRLGGRSLRRTSLGGSGEQQRETKYSRAQAGNRSMHKSFSEVGFSEGEGFRFDACGITKNLT
jgi:hypothetical protein